jgi:hypothetical protein
MLKGRRDQGAKMKRKRLLKLIRVFALIVRVPSLVSDRASRLGWKADTHNNSIASIRVTRQVIRGSRATVHFWLTLRNGTVVKDHETLVRSRDRWFLG